MIAPSNNEHVGDQLGRDGRSALVLFILSCVWVTRNDGSDPTSRSGLACGDDDEKFHEVVIYVAAARLYDENVGVADGLGDFDVNLAVGELAYNGWRQWNA